MSEGINQPNVTDEDDMLDGGDRTEELTQAQQAGFDNKGGLDQKVEDADLVRAAQTRSSSEELSDSGKTGISSNMGDGLGSQSGASAGSGGEGQRT